MTSYFKLFKNVAVYRLSRDTSLSPEEMIKSFDAFRFSPCGPHDFARTGFISPLGDACEELGFTGSGYLMALIKKESRDVPAPVVRDALAEKVGKLEQDQGRKLKKAEKDALKDEVLQSLIPRAFPRYTVTPVLFDLKGGRVFVAGTPRKAEDALALIRKALGSLPVVPLTLETPAELTLTEWVNAQAAPAGFAMGEKADLAAILEAGGLAKLSRQDLTSDEVTTMLAAGKVVTRLELKWQDRIEFLLNDVGCLNAVKFSDELMDQNDDIDREDAAQRTGADIILMAGELCALTDAMVAALGGEAKR